MAKQIKRRKVSAESTGVLAGSPGPGRKRDIERERERESWIFIQGP